MKRGTTAAVYRVRFVAILTFIPFLIQTLAITCERNIISDNDLTRNCSPLQSSTSLCPNSHYLRSFIVSKASFSHESSTHPPNTHSQTWHSQPQSSANAATHLQCLPNSTFPPSQSQSKTSSLTSPPTAVSQSQRSSSHSKPMNLSSGSTMHRSQMIQCSRMDSPTWFLSSTARKVS